MGEISLIMDKILNYRKSKNHSDSNDKMRRDLMVKAEKNNIQNTILAQKQ